MLFVHIFCIAISYRTFSKRILKTNAIVMEGLFYDYQNRRQ
jgi:hypothetical protein